jgi:alpha-tubulin suppressor-like RCC1 family protein
MGWVSTAASKQDGTLWAWGSNNFGQLGQGNTTNLSSPVQVGALTNWPFTTEGTLSAGAAISNTGTAANTTSCFVVKPDGTLWAWGNNFRGQLGTSNTTSYSSPVQVGALTTWSTVCTSGNSTAAVKTDGTLWTWGSNTQGQLGSGTAIGTLRSSPVQVGTDTNWKAACLGGYGGSLVAIKTNGTIWSSGFNFAGTLGLNDTTRRSSLTQIGALTTWSSIVVGGQSTAAISTTGALWTWGTNYGGQLALNNTTNYSSPKQVGSLTNWSLVSLFGGAYNNRANGGFFALKTNGTFWTSGYFTSTGNVLLNGVSASSPSQVGALTTWKFVQLGARQGNGASGNSAVGTIAP